MYTVKLLANTVSENLERELTFYIEDVLKENPGAILDFQYQALNGRNETIYSCLVTVNTSQLKTSIIETHYQDTRKNDAGSVLPRL